MENEVKNNILPLTFRMKLYFGVIAAGMILCIKGIFAILLYPIGVMISIQHLTKVKFDNDLFYMLPGYGIYIVLFLAFLIANRRLVVYILVGVLVLVTLLNVAGCHSLMNQLRHIGN